MAGFLHSICKSKDAHLSGGTRKCERAASGLEGGHLSRHLRLLIPLDQQVVHGCFSYLDQSEGFPNFRPSELMVKIEQMIKIMG